MIAPQFPPVKAVVFDMGGVLTTDPFEGMIAFANKIGIPGSFVADAVRDSAQFKAIETGESTMRDFLKWLCVDIETQFGVRVDIRELAACLASGQQVRPEMILLVRELHAAGLRLAVLTNNAREARSWWESGVLPLELFDLVLDSSELGLRKPDREVYYTALVRLGLTGREVVFVDDFQVNVDGALRAGLRGLTFGDPAQCRSELLAMFHRTNQFDSRKEGMSWL